MDTPERIIAYKSTTGKIFLNEEDCLHENKKEEAINILGKTLYIRYKEDRRYPSDLFIRKEATRQYNTIIAYAPLYKAISHLL